MSRQEKRLLAVVFTVFAVLFYRASLANYFLLQLDTAYFLESIETTRTMGVPSTMMTRSVIHALDHLIPLPADTVCKYPFESDGTSYMPVHNRHLFPIFYPLAAANFVLPSLHVFALCTLIAFPGLLLAIYLLARRWAIPVAGAALLTALVSAHPTWSYASFGQFYPDKLFPVFGLIYFALLYEWIAKGRVRRLPLIIVGLCAISTSERSAIMLAAGSFGVMFLFGWKRKWTRSDLTPVFLTASIVIYALLYMKLVQKNPDYTSFTSAGKSLLGALSANSAAAAPFYKFLLINLLFLAPAAFFAKRWTLIAFGAMIPNLAGSIGGAEKLGWTTHYHSTYFPFLIMVLLAGGAELARRRDRLPLAMSGLAGAIGVFLFLVDPFTRQPLLSFPTLTPLNAGVVKMIALQTDWFNGSALRLNAEHLKQVAERLPVGAEVSTTEMYMPALYWRGVKLIHFYPLGMRASEYVVVPYIGNAGALRYPGHVSYLGPEVAAAADDCLTQILLQHYAVVDRIPATATQGSDIFRLKSRIPERGSQ